MLGPMLVVAVFVALLPSPVHAQSAAGALRSFGFVGEWAPDCSKPAARDNSRRRITVKSGAAQFEEDLGQGSTPNKYVVQSAKQMAPNRIEIRTTFNDKHTAEFTVMKEGRRVRTVDTVADGKTIVKDGAIVGTNAQTVWLNKCQ